MTLVTSDPPKAIGPGSLIRLISSGPYPNDDYFEVDVYPNGGSSGVISGTIYANRFPHIDVYLGWSDRTKQFFGEFDSIAQGQGCNLILWHFHNSGVVVEQTTDTGAWTWTYQSPTFNLLNFVGNSGPVDDIRRAVYRTFPTA